MPLRSASGERANNTFRQAEAARVANTISLPKSRAWAQRAAARGGSRAHQVQAVANALKIEDWTDVVPDLIRVVPEAAHAIYAELTR